MEIDRIDFVGVSVAFFKKAWGVSGITFDSRGVPGIFPKARRCQ